MFIFIGGGNGYNLWLMRNSFFQSLNICEAYLTKLRQLLKRKVTNLRERLKEWDHVI